MTNKANILVVEDERIVARDLQATLERAGYQVPSLAGSGEEAVRSAAKFRPDLILMDIVLQGEMDGIAAAGVIKDQFAIPVIYLTSYGDKRILERAKETEPIGFVLKPFEERDLLTTVEVALHQYRNRTKRAEADLLASEVRFRAVFESAACGMALIDRQALVIESNPAFEKIFGGEFSAHNRRCVLGLICPEDRGRERELHAELFAGNRTRYQLEQRCTRADGRLVWTRATVTAVIGSVVDEEPQFALRMVEDLTDEKRLQEQLLRAQRIETIGTLTGGLVHNLNNLLSPTMMGLNLLRSADAGEKYPELLDTMQASVGRAAAIVDQLLTCGREKPGKRVPFDPGQLMAEVAALIRELFPKCISKETHFQPGLWPVLGNPNQLHQAILNLCTNARDAMPEGGKLILVAENVHVDADKARHLGGANPGSYVVLRVTDTGIGMSEDVRRRLFEPFFTTKPADKGTGLGLVSTLGIVKEHGGAIEIDSEPGTGTEFRVYLPAMLSPVA